MQTEQKRRVSTTAPSSRAKHSSIVPPGHTVHPSASSHPVSVFQGVQLGCRPVFHGFLCGDPLQHLGIQRKSHMFFLCADGKCVFLPLWHLNVFINLNTGGGTSKTGPQLRRRCKKKIYFAGSSCNLKPKHQPLVKTAKTVRAISIFIFFSNSVTLSDLWFCLMAV